MHGWGWGPHFTRALSMIRYCARVLTRLKWQTAKYSFHGHEVEPMLTKSTDVDRDESRDFVQDCLSIDIASKRSLDG